MSYITKQSPTAFTGAGVANYLRNITTSNGSDTPATINLTFRATPENMSYSFMSTTPSYYAFTNASCNATSWAPQIGTGTFTSSGTNNRVGTLGPFPNANVVEIHDMTNGYYTCSTNAACNITTNDFAMEFIIRTPKPSTAIIKKGGEGTAGWDLTTNAGGHVMFTLNKTALINAIATHAASSVSTLGGSWCHVFVACDRSSATGLVMYLNGVAGTPVDPTAVTPIDDSNSAMQIGDSDASTGSMAIAHIGYWDMGTTFAINATVNTAITSRFQAMAAYAASNATTITVTPATTFPTGRSYDSTLSTGRLLKMSKGWVPVSKDSTSHFLHLHGTPTERIDTNPATSPDATWTLVNATLSVNTAIGPDGLKNASKLVVSTGSKTIAYANTTTGSGGTNMIHSVFVRANGIGFAWGEIVGSLGTRRSYINLTTGAVQGDATNTVVIKSENYGVTPDNANPWWKLTWNAGAPASGLWVVGACDALGNDDVVGDGTKGIDVWAPSAQTGVALDMPDTMLIEGANTTRTVGDTVQLVNSNDWCSDTNVNIVCNVYYYPGPNIATDYNLLDLSDGGSANDRIRVTLTASDDNFDVTTTATGGSAGAATAAANGAAGTVIPLKIRLYANSLTLTASGTAGTTDTDVGCPDDLDRLDLYGYIKNIAIRSR